MNCQSALQAAAYNVQLIGNAPERCIPMKICYIQGPGMVVIILMGLGMTFSCVPVYFNHWLVVMNCTALMLLVGWQEGHPACKKLSGEVLAWLSGVGADLHMAPLMPLPLTVSSFSKIQIGSVSSSPG